MNGLRALPVALLGGACVLAGCNGGQAISPDEATVASLRAARMGQTVVVEVGLGRLPVSVRVVTLGLKLADGTVVPPGTVSLARSPAGKVVASPRLDFVFADSGVRCLASAHPDRWLVVTFDLGRRSGVDGSLFSLVLGDPDAPGARRMGITTAVSVRDGSPSLFACIALGDSVEAAGLPRRGRPPEASFRFDEQPSPETLASCVPIRPAIARARPGSADGRLLAFAPPRR